MPTPRLSFRREPRGGATAPPPAESTNALARFDRVVLLIHGYNNDERDAEAAYRGFDRLQRELGQIPERQPVAGGRLVEVYWPGDANWGIFSFLFYMGSIGRALETADLLASALRTAAAARGFLNVDVVAHSMGCRLTMETLKRLEAVPNLHVRRVVFMAAAVATTMLEPEPDEHGLRRAYDHVLTDGAISLYSPADMVLAVAFPLGQTLAPGSEGFLPAALGHERWTGETVPPNLLHRQYQNHGAGHSDYWGWREKTRAVQGRFANEHIRDFLGLGAVVYRSATERDVPMREGVEERSTPEAAGPVEREVGMA